MSKNNKDNSSKPVSRIIVYGVMATFVLLAVILVFVLFEKDKLDSKDNKDNSAKKTQQESYRDTEREKISKDAHATNLRMLGDRLAAALFTNTKINDKMLQAQIKENAFIFKRLSPKDLDSQKDPKNALKTCSPDAGLKNTVVVRYTRLPNEYLSVTNGKYIVVYHILSNKDSKQGLSATSDIFYCLNR